jgi:3-deoxy-D-arabino-heptulosonate 7-phosphate (DAHP) synthase
MNNDLAFNDVDTLGNLLAQIADLTKQADKIKDDIKDGGKTVEGVMFKATYIEANRKVVDTKKMYADLGITDDVVAKYTSISAVYSVKVTAR